MMAFTSASINIAIIVRMRTWSSCRCLHTHSHVHSTGFRWFMYKCNPQEPMREHGRGCQGNHMRINSSS